MKKLLLFFIAALTVFAAFKTAAAASVKTLVRQPIYKKQFELVERAVDSGKHVSSRDLFYLIRNFKSSTSAKHSKPMSTAAGILGSASGYYLPIVSFQHADKDLALLVSRILHKYPGVQKNINWKGPHGETSLYVASALGMPHVVYVLLKNGKYINTFNLVREESKHLFVGGALNSKEGSLYSRYVIPLQVFDRARADGRMSEFAKSVNKMLYKYTEAVTECSTDYVHNAKFDVFDVFANILTLGTASIIRARNGVGTYCIYGLWFRKPTPQQFSTVGYNANHRQDYYWCHEINFRGGSAKLLNSTIKTGQYAKYRTLGSPTSILHF